jgi:hypothetical protein
MGATASHPSPDNPPSRALHVLRVVPGSPAAVAGIQVFFDFVVGIEGYSHGLDVSYSNFILIPYVFNSYVYKQAIDVENLEKVVESHEGQTLSLIVWSSKSRAARSTPLVYQV